MISFGNRWPRYELPDTHSASHLLTRPQCDNAHWCRADETTGRTGVVHMFVGRQRHNPLKHVRNWSYETLEREVRSNVVYRTFCHIGLEKVPDAKTLVRLGQTVGPDAIAQLHARIIAVAQERSVIQGRKMRVDTTVVKSN